MEFVSALADFQRECSCPICLDYLKDPVTISCGHNFCFDCLNHSWKDLTDAFPCPVCRFGFPERKFRRNPQLCNLIEIAQLLQIRKSKRKRQEENAICEKHNQFMTLFCVKDLQILCTQCSFSAEHQRHHICPIKQAATFQRRILESSIQPLKNNVERVEKVLILQDHISTLKRLMKEIKGKCVQSDLALLKDVKSIRQRYQNLKHPELSSLGLNNYSFSLPPQYSGLKRIIKQFHRDVSLDPNTAYPQLIVSEDRKSVTFGRTKQTVCYNSRRFYLCPAVLGSKMFNSGRHYWEVDVGNKPQWTVGVCQDYLLWNWRNLPSVLSGFWAIGRYIESGYVVFGPKKTQLLPVPKPSKIGIFLDFELGEVSFYNGDDRSLLYSFSDSLTKTQTIWPYFYVGTDSKPLKILPVDNER
nr:tripartite motif-containing protein 60-like isoform X2 [Marmota flaviventris]